MKRLTPTLAALFLAAFFVPSIVYAGKPTPTGVCDPVAAEDVLLKGIQDSPELLIKVIEGDDLQVFWAKMRDAHYLMGVADVDKVYIFKSEHHPESVYVFFLRDGCVKNVQMTFKSVIEGML